MGLQGTCDGSRPCLTPVLGETPSSGLQRYRCVQGTQTYTQVNHPYPFHRKVSPSPMGMGIGLQPSESTDNLRDHTKKNGSLLQQPTGASPPKALLTLMLVLWTGFIFCRPPQALSLCCKSHVGPQHSQHASIHNAPPSSLGS